MAELSGLDENPPPDRVLSAARLSEVTFPEPSSISGADESVTYGCVLVMLHYMSFVRYYLDLCLEMYSSLSAIGIEDIMMKKHKK